MRPQIAVVDADAAARHALRRLLSTLPVDTVPFASAEEFLAQSSAALCAIVDARLPGMTGVQLLRHLRAQGNRIPVVVLSAEPDVPTAVEAMRLGAVDFIEKSRMDVALVRRMRQVLHDHADDPRLPAAAP